LVASLFACAALAALRIALHHSAGAAQRMPPTLGKTAPNCPDNRQPAGLVVDEQVGVLCLVRLADTLDWIGGVVMSRTCDIGRTVIARGYDVQVTIRGSTLSVYSISSAGFVCRQTGRGSRRVS